MFFNATDLPCLNVVLDCLVVSTFFIIFKWTEAPLIYIYIGYDIK